MRSALLGKEILAIESPQPRHLHHRWPERLAGRAVRAVDAHGKHLFLRFDGEVTLHSHLRMRGRWGVYRRGEPWRRAPSRAWLVLRTADHEVVQFDGPVLQLVAEAGIRFDRRLAAAGPDVLAEDFDERAFLRRLRDDDGTRAIGDALLDQRKLAGIGNVWKSEGCFLAGVSPWRRLRAVTDAEALSIIEAVRPLMQASVERGGRTVAPQREPPAPRGRSRTWVFERAGLPCRRCAATIRARGQGERNRTTYWCPRCQR